MKRTALATIEPETINYYTLDEAEKILDDRRKLERQNKQKQRKQIFTLKAMSMLLCILSVMMFFASPADGSASVICMLVGLTGLFVPYNMVITWE